MLVLIKIITWMASPVGFFIWASLLGVLLWWARWKQTARLLIGLAATQLIALSFPLTSDALMGSLENRARHLEKAHQQTQPDHAQKKYSAIVVLGGGMSPASPPQRPYPDLGEASDRVWHAARLYRQGIAPKILVSGGHSPGLEGRSDIQTEAQAMRGFLRDLGVPDTALILEEKSRTTRENAGQTQALIGQGRVALVTSAFHMPRALATFKKAGVTADAYPTDFRIAPQVSVPWERWLPNANSLQRSEAAIKEYIAILAGY